MCYDRYVCMLYTILYYLVHITLYMIWYTYLYHGAYTHCIYTHNINLLSYPEAHSLGRGHCAGVIMQEVVHFVRGHLGVGASSIHVHIYRCIHVLLLLLYTRVLYTSLYNTNIHMIYIHIQSSNTYIILYLILYSIYYTLPYTHSNILNLIFFNQILNILELFQYIYIL